jgi:hypothetical protein
MQFCRIVADDTEHLVAATAEQPANNASRMTMVNVEHAISLRFWRSLADGALATLGKQHRIVSGQINAILADKVPLAGFNLHRLIAALVVISLLATPLALRCHTARLAARGGLTTPAFADVKFRKRLSLIAFGAGFHAALRSLWRIA